MRRTKVVWKLGTLLGTLVAIGGFAAIALGFSAGASHGYTLVGPFTGPSKDSSTCGNVWATGTLSRVYKVFPQRPDGSYTVAEQAIDRVVTVAGTSIGACNGGAPDNGHTVGAGIRVISPIQTLLVVQGGTFNANATCPSDKPTCPYGIFAKTFFGAAATIDIVADPLIYESSCNGSWVGRSNDRSTDVGDITGAKKADCDS